MFSQQEWVAFMEKNILIPFNLTTTQKDALFMDMTVSGRGFFFLR